MKCTRMDQGPGLVIRTGHPDRSSEPEVRAGLRVGADAAPGPGLRASNAGEAGFVRPGLRKSPSGV